MSTHALRNMLRNLALVTLGMVSTVRAEHVDWSQYLEPPGAKPMPVKTSESPVAAAPAKKPAAVRQAAKPHSETKAKPKAKPAARKPHR